MHKNIFVLIAAITAFTTLSAEETKNHEQPPSFIVKEEKKQKKQSKNSLKESIGNALKDTLHACSDLNKQSGKLQQKLSVLQKHILNNVETLIDNQRPFKKASRGDLQTALNTIKMSSATIKQQQKCIAQLEQKMNACTCLKGNS